MKRVKLGKTAWLLLAAGVFLVALGWLGLVFSRQNQAQADLNDELGLSQARYGNLATADLQDEYDALIADLEAAQALRDAAAASLDEDITSATITDAFFFIAGECGVRVVGVTTTALTRQPLGEITCLTATLSGMVTGELDDLIAFILALNAGYPTGYVASARVVLPEEDEDSQPSAGVELVLYAYEGS